jgi:hypothetical protein
LELRNSKLKFTRREALLLINQANNLKSKTVKCLNHIFDQTVGNPRAITELINRYRKEPFWTRKQSGKFATGALPEIDMTWIVIVTRLALTSLRFLSREMDEPVAVHRLNGHDFVVLSAR